MAGRAVDQLAQARWVVSRGPRLCGSSSDPVRLSLPTSGNPGKVEHSRLTQDDPRCSS